MSRIGVEQAATVAGPATFAAAPYGANEPVRCAPALGEQFQTATAAMSGVGLKAVASAVALESGSQTSTSSTVYSDRMEPSITFVGLAVTSAIASRRVISAM